MRKLEDGKDDGKDKRRETSSRLAFLLLPIIPRAFIIFLLETTGDESGTISEILAGETVRNWSGVIEKAPPPPIPLFPICLYPERTACLQASKINTGRPFFFFISRPANSKHMCTKYTCFGLWPPEPEVESQQCVAGCHAYSRET